MSRSHGSDRFWQSISLAPPVENGRRVENDWESLSRDLRIHNEVLFIGGAISSQLRENDKGSASRLISS